MRREYIAVIQAGGEGTRLRKLTQDKIPKPLLKINGKPMLEWQIENLIRYRIKEVIIIVRHLGEKIEEYFGNGDKWGIKIEYIREAKPLGSAGSLYFLKDRRNRDFLFIFGDVMFDLNWKRFMDFHEEKKGLATLLVHPNSHPYDSDLVIMDDTNRVTAFDYKGGERKDYYDNCVNSGLYILKSDILNAFGEEKYFDLERDILPRLISEGVVYGYKTPEYVKDAGTPERFRIVSDEQKKGIWNSRNLQNLQKCIFMDRDGTVNKYRGLISNSDEFELENNAAEAVRLINEAGYLAIVVTNQPVVARGMCDLSMVERIHRKMSTRLGERGAYLDDIIFCPHHPDKGYQGENPKYKKKCICRKPLTGMIDEMVEKYHIDRARSYVIGDTTTDIQLGKNANIKTVLVHTGQAGMDGKYDVHADMEAKDLLEAVRKLLVLDEEG